MRREHGKTECLLLADECESNTPFDVLDDLLKWCIRPLDEEVRAERFELVLLIIEVVEGETLHFLE